MLFPTSNVRVLFSTQVVLSLTRTAIIHELEVEKEKQKDDMIEQKTKLERAMLRVGNEIESSDSNVYLWIPSVSAFCMTLGEFGKSKCQKSC